MLSPDEVRRYRETGYLVPDYRLPEEVLDSIERKTRALIASRPEFRDNCSALLRVDPTFAEYCAAPGLLDMVAQLIGPDLALWNMSLFGKPAHDGKATPWHQDGEYWPIRPLATCSVWIAVDESTERNGCLRVIPGSHRARALLRHRDNPSPELTLNQELEESEFDETEAVSVEFERGRISLHDVYLAHGSAANRSGRTRRGMTMRIMPTTSHYDRQLAEEMHRAHPRRFNLAEHPLLLLRGVDRCGRNGFLEPPPTPAPA